LRGDLSTIQLASLTCRSTGVRITESWRRYDGAY
jgi:hypothetical protein